MNWNSTLYDNKHDFVAEYGKELLELIPENRCQRILDLGCGTGTLTVQLAKLADQVVGIDSSENMIEKAKGQFPEFTFMVGNALDLPFENKFDVVFSNAVFHWISDHDTLYILGDVTDRGSGGLRVLLDTASRQNVILLRGNHEQAALEFLPRDPDNEATPARLFARWYEWMEDGGDRTYRAFWNRSEAVRARVLRILGSLPIYAEVQAGGRSFFLAHTVPGKRKMRHPESCRVCDFLTGEPEYELRYDPDRIIVTGHTVTSFIDEASRGRIWRGNGHIAIDCGAVYNGVLSCLCLDTLEEFYVE